MTVIVFVYRSQDPPSVYVQRHVDEIAGGSDNLMQLREWSTPTLGGRPLWMTDSLSRAWRRARVATGTSREELHRGAFSSALRKRRPDAVLAEFGYSGAHILAPCRRLGIPLVVHFHGTDINREELLATYRPHLKPMFDYAAALVVVSEGERIKLTALGAPQEKVHVIPCGAWLPQQQPERERDVAGFRIVSITRMVEVKAPHLVVVSFSRYLQMGGKGTLHMVGDGPLLPFCESLARGLGMAEHCVFHGSLPHRETLDVLGHSHLYVQHSVVARDGDCEGMPLTIMEAAAQGLPIVTTAPGGISEHMVDGTNSFVVREYDTSAMADRMLRVWRDPALATRLGAAAYEMARDRFDASKQSRKLLQLLRSAVAASRGLARGAAVP